MSGEDKDNGVAAINLCDLLDADDGGMVTLVSGETQLAVHKTVLAARSPVFEAMFRHDTLEARTGTITITDVEGPVLCQLLAYLYTLQVPFLPSMYPQLLVAADKYCVSGLEDEFEHQMAAQMTVDNVAVTAVLAERHSCFNLLGAAVIFIKTHFLHVVHTQGWAETEHCQPDAVVEFRRHVAERKGLSAEEKSRRLRKAAEEGAVDEVRALIAAETDVEARGEWELTALHCAAARGHVEAAQSLLEAGVAVDARGQQQCTPLHLAARWGHVAVVRLLLAASADPNPREVDGWTPMHWTAANGEAEAAAALLDWGADRGARDNQGETALDIARACYHQQLVDMLK